MDDLELDRELQTAMAVAPSPDFLARVRVKIAEAPPPSIFAEWLKPAAVISCAAVVVIAVALTNKKETPAQVGLKPSLTNTPSPTNRLITTNAPGTTSVPGTAEVPEPSNVRSVPVTVAPTVPPSRVQRFGGAVEPPLPEVMIAPRDIEALRQFVAGANELRFVASFDETPAPTPWVITELAIAPITIEPLGATSVHN